VQGRYAESTGAKGCAAGCNGNADVKGAETKPLWARSIAIYVVGTVFFVVFALSAGIVLPVGQAVSEVTDRIVASQEPNGAWPGERDFTSSIGGDLASAYEVKEPTRLSGLNRIGRYLYY
jgi:hypothetical protein